MGLYGCFAPEFRLCFGMCSKDGCKFNQNAASFIVIELGAMKGSQMHSLNPMIKSQVAEMKPLKKILRRMIFRPLRTSSDYEVEPMRAFL